MDDEGSVNSRFKKEQQEYLIKQASNSFALLFMLNIHLLTSECLQRHEPAMAAKFLDKVHGKDSLWNEIAALYNAHFKLQKSRRRSGASLKNKYTVTLAAFKTYARV